MSGYRKNRESNGRSSKKMFAANDPLSKREIGYSALFVILICMLVNVWHPYLWGPDEPREAEIARECVVSGNYIVPHFNQVPFVEKPPLYYDLAALAFRLGGGFHPGAARLVSALLGVLMLAAVLVFAGRKLGWFAALTASALCLSMPQFYRAAHWILLDIGVGAWVTAALAVYGIMVLDRSEGSNRLSILFFLLAAAAFLTKGMVTLVYLGIVILPMMIYQRKWLPCRINWTWLCFLIPAGVWVWLFWREGGIYYLHEHFINNTVGRFLHRDLHLEGSPVTVSDVGNSSPWFFYLARLPNMFGGTALLFPFLLASVWRMFRLPFFRVSLSGRAGKIWDLLTAPGENTEADRALIFYLVNWSFAPLLFFSLPAIKEVTYLLPSYAGIALLCAWYLVRRPGADDPGRTDLTWGLIGPCVGFAAVSAAAGMENAAVCLVLYGIIFTGLLVRFLLRLRQKSLSGALFPVLAGMIGAVMLGNTPSVMQETRLNRKCYDDFSRTAWQLTGERQLYLYGGDESIRGALPFYGNRKIVILVSRAELLETMASQGARAVLLTAGTFENLSRKPEFSRLTEKFQIEKPDPAGKAESFVLLLSK